MIRQKKSGFILTLVIILLALAGTQMYVLNATSGSMRFQADMQYLQACRENMAASGLAWARKNLAGDRDIPAGMATELDTSELAIPHANLAVVIGKGEQGHARVRAICSLSLNRLKLEQDKWYQLKD